MERRRAPYIVPANDTTDTLDRPPECVSLFLQPVKKSRINQGE
jgi:hypothetical protein